MPQTRARPELTVLPACPARAGGDRLSRRRSPAPRRDPSRQHPSPPTRILKLLLFCSGPRNTRRSAPGSPGRAELAKAARRRREAARQAGSRGDAGPTRPRSRPCHARGRTGPGWGPGLGVELAHFPAETTQVLLFVPSPPPLFPSHIRVLFLKPEKEDATRQEIAALHFSKSFRNRRHVTFPQLHTRLLWGNAGA